MYEIAYFVLLNMDISISCFLIYMTQDRIVVDQQQQDIKRILVERDITTLKQAFCRIMCAESYKNNNDKELRSFVPHRLFSRDRLKGYLSNKELGFGRQLLEPEDFNVYNTIIDLVIRELVSDGTIAKEQQQKEPTPDNPEERYEVTQNLDTICKDFRDSGLSFY